MSNRKYAAAVLTDNNTPIERKMESTCTILAEIMNIAASEIIKETSLDALGGTESFQSYLDMKYKKMFPELYTKYEAIVGTVPTDDGMWKLVVGWRKKKREAPYYTYSPFEGNRHTAIHHMTMPTFMNEYMNEPYEDLTDASPAETHHIIQEIRDQISTITSSYLGEDLQNNHRSVNAIAEQASHMLQEYRDNRLIHDFQVNAVTTPRGYPDATPSLQFSIIPNIDLERVNIEVNLRP